MRKSEKYPHNRLKGELPLEYLHRKRKVQTFWQGQRQEHRTRRPIERKIYKIGYIHRLSRLMRQTAVAKSTTEKKKESLRKWLAL